MVVVNGQQHAMLIIAADKRMLDGAWSEVVGVNATGPMADVAQRRRADGCEAVLPDARFVTQRIVGMAREDNRVRKFHERLRGGAVVVAPNPRPMACALRMRMLRIEERQLRIDFRLVRRHEFADLPMMRPVAADEHIAFDVLHHDFLPLLMEALIPCGLDILHDGGFKQRLAFFRIRLRIFPAFEIVVALNKELLDMAAIRPLVVREDFVPAVSEVLKLLQLRSIRDITSHQHDIDALRVIPSQCLFPYARGLWIHIDMNIADDADAQFRHGGFLFLRAKQSHAAERRDSRSGKQALQKISSGEIKHSMVLLSGLVYHQLFNSAIYSYKYTVENEGTNNQVYTFSFTKNGSDYNTKGDIAYSMRVPEGLELATLKLYAVTVTGESEIKYTADGNFISFKTAVKTIRFVSEGGVAPGPVNPEPSEPDKQPSKSGCGADVASVSAMFISVTLLGTILVSFKKRFIRK